MDTHISVSYTVRLISTHLDFSSSQRVELIEVDRKVITPSICWLSLTDFRLQAGEQVFSKHTTDGILAFLSLWASYPSWQLLTSFFFQHIPQSMFFT